MQANAISDDDPISMLMTEANHDLVVNMMGLSDTQDIKADVQKSKHKAAKRTAPAEACGTATPAAAVASTFTSLSSGLSGTTSGPVVANRDRQRSPVAESAVTHEEVKQWKLDVNWCSVTREDARFNR